MFVHCFCLFKPNHPASHADALVERRLQKVTVVIVDFRKAAILDDVLSIFFEVVSCFFFVTFFTSALVENAEQFDIFHAPEAPNCIAAIRGDGESDDEKLSMRTSRLLILDGKWTSDTVLIDIVDAVCEIVLLSGLSGVEESCRKHNQPIG